MRKKKLYKIIYLQIIPLIALGFALGVITIWPKIIFENNRKCFFDILIDGSDGNVELKTIFSIDPNYLFKIKNAKSKYFKFLLIGDSCFR